jgi:hypothetical protein
MNSLRKGIILGALQCLLVLSVTGKLLYDRAICPRVWVKTERFDPNLPIRGRYLSLLLAPQAGDLFYNRLHNQPVVFFVPEHPAKFESPAFGPDHPELWAEVTIPHQGPPRPIRLGIKTTGQIQPVPVN